MNPAPAKPKTQRLLYNTLHQWPAQVPRQQVDWSSRFCKQTLSLKLLVMHRPFGIITRRDLQVLIHDILRTDSWHNSNRVNSFELSLICGHRSVVPILNGTYLKDRACTTSLRKSATITSFISCWTPTRPWKVAETAGNIMEIYFVNKDYIRETAAWRRNTSRLRLYKEL